MKDRIFLSSPHMGGKEQSFINEAFETNWISPLGLNVDGFEKDICKFTGAHHCAVLSSGTAAIHLALIMLGIKRDDEVLVSTFTFSATINPIIYQGAVPVFIESEPDTWNMCPAYLEEAIIDRIANGKKPKAIILVHLYGMPAKLDEIVSIAQKYEIPIIEDAAEALGAKYKGKHLGSFGDLGVFSFNGNKIITTSGGGALVSDKEEWILTARFLATQARDEAPHYQHTQVGYNYRMSNIVAGIGRGQMEVLDEWVQRRRNNFQFYVDHLSDLPGIEFLAEPSVDYFSNRWLTTILIDPKKSDGKGREYIRLALEKNTIEARPLWKPMHLQPVFQDYPYYGDRYSERLFEIGLCLPSGSNLRQEELDRVVGIVRDLMIS